MINPSETYERYISSFGSTFDTFDQLLRKLPNEVRKELRVYKNTRIEPEINSFLHKIPLDSKVALERIAQTLSDKDVFRRLHWFNKPTVVDLLSALSVPALYDLPESSTDSVKNIIMGDNASLFTKGILSAAFGDENKNLNLDTYLENCRQKGIKADNDIMVRSHRIDFQEELRRKAHQQGIKPTLEELTDVEINFLFTRIPENPKEIARTIGYYNSVSSTPLLGIVEKRIFNTRDEEAHKRFEYLIAAIGNERVGSNKNSIAYKVAMALNERPEAKADFLFTLGICYSIFRFNKSEYVTKKYVRKIAKLAGIYEDNPGAIQGIMKKIAKRMRGVINEAFISEYERNMFLHGRVQDNAEKLIDRLLHKHSGSKYSRGYTKFRSNAKQATKRVYDNSFGLIGRVVDYSDDLILRTFDSIVGEMDNKVRESERYRAADHSNINPRMLNSEKAANFFRGVLLTSIISSIAIAKPEGEVMSNAEALRNFSPLVAWFAGYTANQFDKMKYLSLPLMLYGAYVVSSDPSLASLIGCMGVMSVPAIHYSKETKLMPTPVK